MVFLLTVNIIFYNSSNLVANISLQYALFDTFSALYTYFNAQQINIHQKRRR